MARNKKHPMRHYGASDDAKGVYEFYKIWYNHKIIARFIVAIIAAVSIGYLTHGALNAIVKSSNQIATNQPIYSSIKDRDRPTINICTWDLDGAGNSNDDMSIIASVLQSCDIASLQSVRKKQYQLISRSLGKTYQRTKLTSAMVIFFNTSLVHSTGRIWLRDKRINQRFKFKPMVSEYRSGLFQFSMTQVNIKSDTQNEALKETSALDNLVEYALSKTTPNKNLIISGNFKYMPSSVAMNALRQKGFKNVITDKESGTQNIWVNPNITKQIIQESSSVIRIPDLQINGIMMPSHLPVMVKALVDD